MSLSLLLLMYLLASVLFTLPFIVRYLRVKKLEQQDSGLASVNFMKINSF